MSARQEIMQAAGLVVLEEGAAHLTLEAVARRAGVSKGGLLYHFPNKEALIKGLIEYLNEQFDGEVARQLDREGSDRPGGWLRAYVRATFETEQYNHFFQQNSAALLAATATNPQLLEPFRASFARYQQQVAQSGLDPALATVIRLAADGLWLADLFGLAPPQGELRQQILAKLLELSAPEGDK